MRCMRIRQWSGPFSRHLKGALKKRRRYFSYLPAPDFFWRLISGAHFNGRWGFVFWLSLWFWLYVIFIWRFWVMYFRFWRILTEGSGRVSGRHLSYPWATGSLPYLSWWSICFRFFWFFCFRIILARFSFSISLISKFVWLLLDKAWSEFFKENILFKS